MKKLLGLALLLLSPLLHAQGLPFLDANKIVCGQSNGVMKSCDQLPSINNLPNLSDGTMWANLSGLGVPGIPQEVNFLLIPTAVSGSVLGATSTSALAWSVTLSAGQIVLGGGAGATPTTAGFVVSPNTNSMSYGVNAGQSMGTGGVAVGVNSLNAATGNNNVCIGYQCGNFISSGIQNMGLGTAALKGVTGTPTTGNNNTCMGYNCLTNVQGATNNNTAVGQSAGSSITTGQSNTCIGNAVCSSGLTTGSNNTLIGNNNSDVTSGTAVSNEIHIAAGGAGVYNATGGGTPSTAKAWTSGPFSPGLPLTIGTLPTCNSGLQGYRLFVTDGQTTPTFLGAVSTTGTTPAPVVCNGTGWVYG